MRPVASLVTLAAAKILGPLHAAIVDSKNGVEAIHSMLENLSHVEGWE